MSGYVLEAAGTDLVAAIPGSRSRGEYVWTQPASRPGERSAIRRPARNRLTITTLTDQAGPETRGRRLQQQRWPVLNISASRAAMSRSTSS